MNDKEYAVLESQFTSEYGCSYCDNGSFKDVIDGISNHVKCDHCKGRGSCPCEECEESN